jgi:hypothetical protein
VFEGNEEYLEQIENKLGLDSETYFFTSDASDRPFLYAATGVDDADRFITNTRGGSRSYLAALAFLGTSGTTGGGGLPPPLTGTSLAAAVTSAAASAAWAYAPRKTATEIMDIVYAAGVPLVDQDGGTQMSDRPLTSSIDGSPKPIRRVDVCNSIKSACPGCSGACNPPESVLGLSDAGADATDLKRDIDALFVHADQLNLIKLDAGALTPSQQSQNISTAPRGSVDPAPSNGCGCSTCLVANNKLYVAIESSSTIKELVLTLTSAETGVSWNVSDPYDKAGSSPFTAELPTDAPVLSSVQTATLSCSIDSGGVTASGSEQLLIVF